MKRLSQSWLLWLAVALCWRAEAQTNVAPVILTNVITAAGSFREVNGQLYNTEHSVLWTNLHGDILRVSTNGIVVSTFTMKPVYQAVTTSRATYNYMGGLKGYRPVATTVPVGTEKADGMKLILRNFPAKLYPAVGQTISFRAMRVGTSDFDGDTLELWDFGTPHVVMVITTNYPRAFKTENK